MIMEISQAAGGRVIEPKNSRSSENFWFNNAIVYHVVTDRFYRGNRNRISMYQRDLDVSERGGFHGGDFLGITAKIRAGWFNQLGVNCLWLSAPYEQIHGWVPGGDGEYRHHPFHGYWPLDYTVVEPSFGTADDLRELVEVAHAAGIRVVLDVGLSHPGYPDLQTLHNYLPDIVRPGWEDATPNTYSQYFDYNHRNFAQWWGADWVRADIPGYRQLGAGPHTGLLHGLPRFMLDSEQMVTPPEFLLSKADSKVRLRPNSSVRSYLIEWLVEWVRELGIDGFRCDSAKHVDFDTWLQLKDSAQEAFSNWKRVYPEKVLDASPFWMVGEVYGHGIERSDYYDYGFDSLLNFCFQGELLEIIGLWKSSHTYAHALAMHRLDQLYQRYATRVSNDVACNLLSYVSSHDTGLFNRAFACEAGTALLLVPGGIQILYGDETGRPAIEGNDSVAWCSDMNWDTADSTALAHWCQVGAFRARHVAIARGHHRRHLEVPYAFSRTDDVTGDRVLVVIGKADKNIIDVTGVFDNGTTLVDAIDSGIYRVVDGKICVSSTNVMLIEPVARDTVGNGSGA